jgi:hypothetical protein
MKDEGTRMKVDRGWSAGEVGATRQGEVEALSG